MMGASTRGGVLRSGGVASIRAATDHDMFLALGYVHARFRLTEMDEARRLGEGRLAQLAGPSDLASDKFELQLGLLRTAQLEWTQMPKDGGQIKSRCSPRPHPPQGKRTD